MSLKGVLNSLNQEFTRIESLHKRTNMTDFNQYTVLIGQTAPIFKQAEVFEFLCEGNDVNDITDRAALLKQCPKLVFPSKEELDSVRDEVNKFCQRVLAFSEQINAHGYQHAQDKRDESLNKSFTVEILAMYLRVMILPEEASTPDERMLILNTIRSHQGNPGQDCSNTSKQRHVHTPRK